jgi:predicted MFS family arabinose efflux permease
MANVNRKRLFIGVLTIIGLSNVLAAVAPNYGTMAVARIIPALALPVFWSLASATAVDLMGADRAGRAISIISFGIVCATVFGIPIGTLVSDAFGWRSAFSVLAVVAFGKALMLFAFFPGAESQKTQISLAQQARILRDPMVVVHVVLSVLMFTGMFTAYTYLADMLERLAGFDGALVGWSLMGFGAVGVIGNFVGGRMVDRTPLGASLAFALLIAAGMLAIVPSIRSQWSLIAALGAWGIAQAALLLVSHVRVMKSAPSAPAFAASLNISGANLGIGLGAFVGGYVIDSTGIESIGFAAAAIIVLAILVNLGLMLAARAPRATQACQAGIQ